MPELGPAVEYEVRARLGLTEADAFLARLEMLSPDITEPLGQVYGGVIDLPKYATQLVLDALGAAAARPAELRRLDRRREIDQAWFQRSRMIGYVCYANRFAGSLPGVRQHLDYLVELGVSYLHLMPLLHRRLHPPALPGRLLRRPVSRLVRPWRAVPGQPGHRRGPHLRDGLVSVRHRGRARGWRPGRDHRCHQAAGVHVRHRLLLRRHPAHLHGRRTGHAQRPRVGRGPGARARQPVDAPAADGLGPGQTAARPGFSGRPGVRRHPRAGPREALAARAAGRRQHRDPAGRTPQHAVLPPGAPAQRAVPLADQLQRCHPGTRCRDHRRAGLGEPVHVHSSTGRLDIADGRIELPPWGFAWLTGT